MSGFIADNSSYNISTDMLMSVILSHFDTDYIYGNIKTAIESKYLEPLPLLTNVVYGYNENFKQLMFTYNNPDDIQQILSTRNTVYKDIIELLCNEYNLDLNSELYTENYDLYTAAFYMYKLLVSEFTQCVKQFFVNFIIKERNNLYLSLNLAQYKREKDSSTIYNKKRIKNSKLAIIISKLGYVIDNICVFDIPFQTYLNYTCDDKNMVQYLSTMIAPKDDFFKKYVTPMFDRNSPVKPMLLSDITMLLYNQLISEGDNLIDYIEDDE